MISTNCDAHFAKSIFQTHSNFKRGKAYDYIK
ncbi:DUF6783 domain-containing protein [Blautia wexlerae]